MEKYIKDNILSMDLYTDQLYSKGFKIYFYLLIENENYLQSIDNQFQSIKRLYLIDMLENDNFLTIKLKTFGIESNQLMADQFVNTIIELYPIRSKLSNNFNLALSKGGYSMVEWFINISSNVKTGNKELSIPLLPFLNCQITNTLKSKVIYSGWSLSNKLNFLIKCSNASINGSLLDQLVESLYPFYGITNYGQTFSLLKNLNSFNSLQKIIKSYIYEKVIPNCDQSEIIAINNSSVIEGNKNQRVFWSVFQMDSEIYSKLSIFSKLQSNVGSVKFNEFINTCLKLVKIGDCILESLFSFCLVKSKLKQFIVDNEIISLKLLPFIIKIQKKKDDKEENKRKSQFEILKFILSNYIDFSKFLNSLNLIELLESLITLKYPIEFIKLVYKALNDSSNGKNSDNNLENMFSKSSFKTVDLILKNDDDKDGYYKELLKLSLINHKFIFWSDIMVSPYSFTSIIKNITSTTTTTTTFNDEEISNLLKSYKLNNNNSIGGKLFNFGNNNISTGSGGGGGLFDIGSSNSERFRKSNASGGNIKKKNVGLILNFTFKNALSITPSIQPIKPIDIYGLIKCGKIYKAYEILKENNGNWLHFNFTNQDLLKIIKYCEFEVIVEFSRFFNPDSTYTLIDCNNRPDVFEF